MDFVHAIAVVLAAAVWAYLTVALLKPEWFQ